MKWLIVITTLCLFVVPNASQSMSSSDSPIRFSLIFNFTSDLENITSELANSTVRSRETEIGSTLNTSFSSFLGITVNSFENSNGSFVVVSELQFSGNDSAPNETDIKNALSPLNITIISIRLLSNTTMVPNASQSMSSSDSPIRFSLIFNFTSDLDNITSELANSTVISRATEIGSALNTSFSSFLGITVNSFTNSNGSFEVDSELRFSGNDSAPNETDIKNALSQLNITIISIRLLNDTTDILSTPAPTTPTATTVSQTAPMTPTTPDNQNQTTSMNETAPVTPATPDNQNQTTSMNQTAPMTPTTPDNQNQTTPITPVNQTTSTIQTPAATTQSLEPFFPLEFTSNEPFVEALSDTNSPQFMERAARVQQQLNSIYSRRFRLFRFSRVRRFRPGSIVTEAELVFARNDSVPLPNPSNLTETLVEAVNSGNFSIPVNVSTIRTSDPVIPTPAPMVPMTSQDTPVNQTTPTPTPIPTTATPEVAFRFSFVFSEPGVFTSDLADQNSGEFRNRSTETRARLEPVLRRTFSNFIRMIINSFRNGSIVTDSTLEFQNGSPPNPTGVASVLRDLNITVLSFSLLSDTNVTTTMVPASQTTIAPAVASRFLLIFSTNDTFTNDLAISTSAAFEQRVSNTRAMFEPVLDSSFTSFIDMTVLSFRNGSVITDSLLNFAMNNNASVESIRQVLSQLNIDILTLSGAGHLAMTPFTLFLVTLLSLLLSAFMHST